MSENKTKYTLFPLFLWSFVVIKWVGTSLAAWSWWWVLFPIVPVLAVVLQKLGLL